MSPSLTDIYHAYVEAHDPPPGRPKNLGRGMTTFFNGPLRPWLHTAMFDGQYLELADRQQFNAIFGPRLDPRALDKFQQLWAARIHRPRSLLLFELLLSNMTGTPRPSIATSLNEARLTSWRYEKCAPSS